MNYLELSICHEYYKNKKNKTILENHMYHIVTCALLDVHNKEKKRR